MHLRTVDETRKIDDNNNHNRNSDNNIDDDDDNDDEKRDRYNQTNAKQCETFEIKSSAEKRISAEIKSIPLNNWSFVIHILDQV